MGNQLIMTVGADCHLEGASTSLINALKQQLTIDNPKYRDAKKYGRWIGKGVKPKLYFFEMSDSGIRFPRGFANNAVRLIRREGDGADPVIVDKRQTLSKVDLEFYGELRPYQAEALDDMLKHDFGVIESGTGSGKTIIALAVAAERKQPTLVLVHTKELMYQWKERIKTFLNIEAGLIGDGKYEISPVTVAIINSARNRLSELSELFGHICVDECHRVPASMFIDVVKAFNCRFMMGLSATAYRRDGLTRLIYFYLGDLCHRIDSEKLHSIGAVLKPEFIQHETGFKYTYRDDYQAMLSALTLDEARNRQIVDDVVLEAGRGASGTILVVSDRVAHCETLGFLLKEKGVNVAVLTGRLSSEIRSEIVESTRNGAIKVLVSSLQLMGEGFDCPGLTTLFITTPIKFTGRLLQVVGRILRPAEGKRARVHDYIDSVGVLKSSARARMRIMTL